MHRLKLFLRKKIVYIDKMSSLTISYVYVMHSVTLVSTLSYLALVSVISPSSLQTPFPFLYFFLFSFCDLLIATRMVCLSIGSELTVRTNSRLSIW